MSIDTRRAGLLLLTLSFVGFVSLGLPDGLLGVAWPSIRQSFGVPLDGLGALLLTTTAGYVLASLGSGWLVGRLGVGSLLALSGFATALGLLGYALAPAWWAMVALGLLAGLGAGAIDAAMNAFAAVRFSPRLLNWLHASYGLGVALGPAVMGTVLGAGRSWRVGYALVGGLQGLLGVSFLLTADRWRGSRAAPERPREPTGHAAHLVESLRLPAAWLGIGLFFVYTGLEVSAGQWSYSFFTQARSVAPEVAAFWVGVYWASLGAGRVLVGAVANRVRPVALVRVSMLGVLVGAVLVWWDLAELLSLLGLGLMGLAAAGIFPSLVSSTPRRLGAAHAANVIGLQIGAASLGGALVPGLAGVLAERFGLEAIPPFLAAAALVMLALHEAIARSRA